MTKEQFISAIEDQGFVKTSTVPYLSFVKPGNSRILIEDGNFAMIRNTGRSGMRIFKWYPIADVTEILPEGIMVA